MAGEIGSGFGDDRPGTRTHQGVDIPAASGTSVSSLLSGTVTFAGSQGGYGRVVYLDHGDGVQTRYAHLSSIAVDEGDTVQAGSELGEVGSTGTSTGPHLHFEYRIDGAAVPPAPYLACDEAPESDSADPGAGQGDEPERDGDDAVESDGGDAEPASTAAAESPTATARTHTVAPGTRCGGSPQDSSETPNAGRRSTR